MCDIYNGAQCKSYSWTQNHSDIEIRIKVTHVIRYQDVSFTITPNTIDIKLLRQARNGQSWHPPNGHLTNSPVCLLDVTLLKGVFEHRVDTDSVYWLIDIEEPGIVVYVDKSEPMWWRKLLLDERVVKAGPTNYSVSMDHLDDGSRMVIDKLVNEQRTKLVNSHNNTHNKDTRMRKF